MRPLVLLSNNLSLFIEINRQCNDQGWFISNITDTKKTLTLVKDEQISGLIWDLSTAPLKDNLQELQQIREKIDGPIMVFSPAENHEERVACYHMNIDAYMIEPLDYLELIARMRQLLWVYNRHNDQEDNQLISFTTNSEKTVASKRDQLEIDFKQYRVTSGGVDLGLTPKEFSLLWYLMKHRGQVLSRDQLLEGVWGYDANGSSRIIDIHISHLRDKLENNPQDPIWIKTVRGFGYILDNSYPLIAEGV